MQNKVFIIKKESASISVSVYVFEAVTIQGEVGHMSSQQRGQPISVACPLRLQG